MDPLNNELIEQLLPKWTKMVSIESGGRDPLGLSRVSSILTDYLLTGVTSQTDRARYYSFICWALWHIEKYEKIIIYEDYVDSFRKKEAILALASILDNKKNSPVGVKAAQIQLEKLKQDKTLNYNFRILPSNQFGAYGQYYGGSLYALGLTHRPEENGIDRVTEKGAKVAEIFHGIIGQTPYIKNKIYDQDELTLSDLNKSKKRLSINSIHESFTEKERMILIDMLFSIDKESIDERSEYRKNTLTSILYTLSEYEKNNLNPIYGSTADIDWYFLYPIAYYKVLWSNENKTIPIEIPPRLEKSLSLWRQFCLHEFFTQSIESLLNIVLEICGREISGLSIDEIVPHIVKKGFLQRLKELSGKKSSSPNELMHNLGMSCIPDKNISEMLNQQYSLYDEISEYLIFSDTKKEEEKAANSICVIAIIYGKWRGIDDDFGFENTLIHSGSEMWIGSIFSFLDNWFNSNITWEEALADIINFFIINQHEKIKYEKNRLDSCWLKNIDGRILKENDYTPNWRASRFKSAISILKDLQLINISQDSKLSLSTEGNSLLKSIL